MAHYAYINESSMVTSVIVGPDEGAGSWGAYFSADGKGESIQTSYNTHGGVHYTDGEPSEDQSKALRFNYAGIGFTYDENRDAFIPPQPYPSWVLDEGTCQWVAPIAYPAEGDHVWDEQAGDWVEVTDETL
jgi:hypothetical protein